MAQGKGGEQMAPGQEPVASGQERITGTVTISDAMKGKVSRMTCYLCWRVGIRSAHAAGGYAQAGEGFADEI